jgi:predicted Zn-dependent protease
LLAVVFTAGCTTNTITGRSQLMVVSEQSAISGSASAYSSMMGGLSKKGKIETGTPRALRVKEITDRLVAQAVRFRPDSASWKWEVQVIQEPKVVNAFCMAGGKMAIYTGFWDKLKATDDEIAAVMGHEAGHALASHTREKMSVGLTTQVGALAVAAVLSRDGSGFARNADALSSAAALAITLPNSREAENEADQIGIELAARAGFDPRASVSLWQKMQKGDGPNVPEFISTHPSHDTRIQNLSALVPRVDPLYQAAKAGKSPAGPETMTFVAEAFEKFKRGEVVLECGVPCAFAYARHKGDWKEMQGKQAWRELAVSVMNVGYKDDDSYAYLAEAAAGLGLPAAARTYRERAAALKKK